MLAPVRDLVPPLTTGMSESSLLSEAVSIAHEEESTSELRPVEVSDDFSESSILRLREISRAEKSLLPSFLLERVKWE